MTDNNLSNVEHGQFARTFQPKLQDFSAGAQGQQSFTLQPLEPTLPSYEDTLAISQEAGRELLDAERRLVAARRMEGLRLVALMDEGGEEVRQQVGKGEYFYHLNSPSTVDDLAMFGRDAMEACGRGGEESMEWADYLISGMDEGERRTQYRRKFDTLRASGSDTAVEWQALIGEIVRDDFQLEYREGKAREEEARKVYESNVARADYLMRTIVQKPLDGVTMEDFELLKKLGYSADSVHRARMAYHTIHQRESGKGVSLAYVIDDEKARELLLHAVTQDSRDETQKWEFDNPILNFLSTTTRAGGRVLKGWGEFAAPEAVGNFRRDFALLSNRQNMIVDDGSGKPTTRPRTAEEIEAFDRASKNIGRQEIEFLGDVRNAVAEGEDAYKKGTGYRASRLGASVLEMGAFIMEFEAAAPYAIYKMFNETLETKAAAGRGKSKWRDVLLSSAGYTAAGVAGFKYAPKIFWGATGMLSRGVRFTGSRAGRALTRGLATKPGSMIGATGRMMADLGVVIPASTSAGNWAVDQIIRDPALASGADELRALGKELGTIEYWGEIALNSVIWGASGAYRGRKSMDEAVRRQLNRIGFTEEQREEVVALNPVDRRSRVNELHLRNVTDDPVGTAKRAIAARKLEGRKGAHLDARKDDAVQAALEVAGISLESAEEEGMVRVYSGGKVTTDGKFERGEKMTLLTEAEADAFVDMYMGDYLNKTSKAMRAVTAKERILEAILHKLKGKVSVNYMPSSSTRDGMRKKAEMARERAEAATREIMEKEGISEAEARKRALAETHADIDKVYTLGEVIGHHELFEKRAAREEALGGEAKSSPAWVATRRSKVGKKLLERIFNIAEHVKDYTVRKLAEEFGEQIAKDWMEEQGLDYADIYRALRLLQAEMEKHPDERVRKAASFLTLKKLASELEQRVMGERRESDADLTPEELATLRGEVVETLSDMMLSDLMHSARDVHGEFPEWARDLFNVARLNEAEMRRAIELAHALSTARAEGWMSEFLRKVLGVAPEAVESAIRGKGEPTAEDYRRDFMQKLMRQDEMDAEYGRGVLRDPAETERFEADCVEGQAKADSEREEREEEEGAGARERLRELEDENPDMTHGEAVRTAGEKAADAKEGELAADPAAEADPAFSGGRCLVVTEEGGLLVKAGMVPVEGLEILPNFKVGADAESGVVHPLTGDYRPDHDPIRIWRRADGTLVVISGRHRLDACKRAGVSRIMAYLYEESAVCNESWARRFDVESNIRDNQATPLEVALYVRGEFTDGRALTDEEVSRAGINREGKMGAMGYRIGRNAGESVINALRNGQIEANVALWIADFCPGNEAVQRRGLERALAGAGKGEILARMEAEVALKKMQGELGVEGGTDLFGNAIDNDGFMDFVAQYVNRKRNELAKDISYLRTNAGKRNSEAMAKKYGVNVGDKDSLKKALSDMQTLADRWKNPYTDESLMGEIRDAWQKENGGAEASSKAVFERYFESRREPRNEGNPTEYAEAEADFSIGGMSAKEASIAEGRGEVYIDRADGKKKFIISNRDARINSGVTLGQMNVPVDGHKDVSLASVMHHPALYRNYPQLANMRVRFYRPNEETGVRGYFRPASRGEAAMIAINMNHFQVERGNKKQAELNLETLMGVLLHESQHAIQTFEGFAMGAGSFNQAQALSYLDAAIHNRRNLGVHDDWARDNMDFLKQLKRDVANGDEAAIQATYFYSHGERESRFVQNDMGSSPLNSLTEPATTIAVPEIPSDLGGVTFKGMGRFDYLLESRLAPQGEFASDRLINQAKESVVRLTKRLNGIVRMGEAEGLQLAAEGEAVISAVEALLPHSYGFGLEAYKLYFSFYSRLHESGSPLHAASVIPMKGWDKMMVQAMRKLQNEMMMGDVRVSDVEFWQGVDGKHRAKMAQYAAQYKALYDARKSELDGLRGKARRERDAEIKEEIWQSMPAGARIETMQLIGEMRADKLMAKFLERVALQIDHFRKDRTLGRIRREVDRLTPLPSKDGKPVKGRMDADSYRKVQDMVKLLELTQGERDLFLRDHYTGEEGTSEKAWADLEAKDLIQVPVYDAEGNPQTLTCTKGEFEVYACFDAMSAAQAEAASRALGEFISTGRQAWENAEAAETARIGALCAPLLEGYAETVNEKQARRNAQRRGELLGRKFLNLLGWGQNDVQFFDSLTGIPEIAEWASDAMYRASQAKYLIETNEQHRAQFLRAACLRACGGKTTRDYHRFLEDICEVRDTGIEIKPQMPDFLGQEMAVVRRQFLGLLNRKTHAKNFRPNTFAEGLRYLVGSGTMPKELAGEALAKYGEIGDASKSYLKGEKALASVLTAREFDRFKSLVATARERVDKAKAEWKKSDKGENHLKSLMDSHGVTREMSRAQAAYHVLLAEQADYAEMLRLQGYTADVLAKLREFAGADVMRLARELRDEMGARTAEVKDMYERVFGMPFPEVDNYFRACFDVHHDVREHAVMDGQGFGVAAGGGKVKSLYTRQQHNRPIAYDENILTAFRLGMKEQDTLLAYGTLPQELTRILNYKLDEGATMREALKEKLGENSVVELELHIQNMSRLQVEVEQVGKGMLALLNRLSNASAVSLLNFRISSLLKQRTAIFNTFAGSDMVTSWEWKKSAARVRFGMGKISVAEMAERPELSSRFKGWSASVDAAAGAGLHNVKVSHGANSSIVKGGMTLMEWVDMRANAHSSAILYDAVYRKLQKENPDMRKEDIDEMAMLEVRLALAKKSQPLDWRSRSLTATKLGMFKLGNLFLGGESMNTFGNIARLISRGKKGDYKKAAEAWFWHGAALQALTAFYHFLTDSEDERERRSFVGYLWGTLLGPIAGVPIISEIGNGAVYAASQIFPKDWGRLQYMPDQGLLPGTDLKRLTRDVKKMTNPQASWVDRTLALESVGRTLAIAVAAFAHNPKSVGGARAQAAAYATAAILNVFDFVMRFGRAVDERL